MPSQEPLAKAAEEHNEKGEVEFDDVFEVSDEEGIRDDEEEDGDYEGEQDENDEGEEDDDEGEEQGLCQFPKLQDRLNKILESWPNHLMHPSWRAHLSIPDERAFMVRQVVDCVPIPVGRLLDDDVPPTIDALAAMPWENSKRAGVYGHVIGGRSPSIVCRVRRTCETGYQTYGIPAERS